MGLQDSGGIQSGGSSYDRSDRVNRRVCPLVMYTGRKEFRLWSRRLQSIKENNGSVTAENHGESRTTVEVVEMTVVVCLS